VFARFVGHHFELFKVRPDGSGLVRLTRNGVEDEAPRWSPDGRRLLALENGRLVIRSADGSAPRRLPATGYEANWSPKGRLIAYLVGSCEDPSGKLGDACADLWVIRPDGSGRRRLAADVDLTLDSRPYAWAPDGRRLVYVKAGAPGELVIVTVRDGRKRTLGGTRRALSTDPAWSPDGRWIAFSRQRGPFQGSDLYASAPDGTKLRRLARGRDARGQAGLRTVAASRISFP
jgi:Tol biopolymer transport system component